MDPQKRRRQIIDVAESLFAERGYWGTSLQDVADGCELTVAGLLHHVHSKINLLMMVLNQQDYDTIQITASQMGIDAKDLADFNKDVYPPIDRMCEELVSYNAQHPAKVRLYCILNAEALDPSHPAYEMLRQREQQTLKAFVTAIGSTSDDAVSLARTLLAVMDGLQLQWLRDQEHVDFMTEWKRATAYLPGFGGNAPVIEHA